MPASTPTRAIDRLRKAANLEPTKKNVELSDGSTFEMWVSPLTMAERERAQKQAKSEDANAFALQLLISKALDENGAKLFAPR
jgi:cell division inhibitor SulA